MVAMSNLAKVEGSFETEWSGDQFYVVLKQYTEQVKFYCCFSSFFFYFFFYILVTLFFITIHYLFEKLHVV